MCRFLAAIFFLLLHRCLSWARPFFSQRFQCESFIREHVEWIESLDLKCTCSLADKQWRNFFSSLLARAANKDETREKNKTWTNEIYAKGIRMWNGIVFCSLCMCVCMYATRTNQADAILQRLSVQLAAGLRNPFIVLFILCIKTFHSFIHSQSTHCNEHDENINGNIHTIRHTVQLTLVHNIHSRKKKKLICLIHEAFECLNNNFASELTARHSSANPSFVWRFNHFDDLDKYAPSNC